jgi:alginate O-acetyltransferase complex protein AlgI
MTFVSIEYLFFLPLVLLLYFLLPHKFRWGLLLVASYLFYAYWNAAFLILIIVSTLVDYWAGIQMDKQKVKNDKKKFLYASLFVNLGMLFFFKYFSFCNEVVRDALSIFGTTYDVDKIDILLPVGISFYTFQTLSYTIDIYRGSRAVEKHLGMFALYVSFFPQLVAGPIERSTRLLPQLYTKQKFKWENISIGFRLILWGAFKKIIIADYTYLFLSNVFGNPEIYSGLAYVIAAFGVALWIYADFSGYTDMAIGSAKLFGVNLFPNFKRPYLSRTIAELWQRWHISLTNWINHYIFRPWIRNTKNENQRHLVTIAVFFIIGLWHGANWTFIAFGVFHGLLTVIYRLTKKPNRSLMKLLFGQGRIRKLADILLTFSLWSFSGFFFFSDSIKKSFKMIYNMFNWNMNDLHLMISMPNFKATELCIVGFGTVLLIFSDLINSKDLENPFDNIKKRYIRWIIYLMLLFGLIVFGHQIENQFFYFQV